MAEDAGVGGAFEVGSAYVSVSPDAETFPEQLEEQLGGLDYVVTIPVRADTAGLQESVDAAAAAAEAQATVVVPVTADPAGLKESVDAAAASSGAAVTVPLEADPADLAAQAGAAAAAAGEEAGASFAEKFSSVASSTSLFAPDEGAMAAEGAAAGEASGAGFTEKLAAALAAVPPVPWPEAEADAASAGEAAGEAFTGTFAAATAGIAAPLAGLGPAAEEEGAAAGEEAGASFVSRLGAMLSGVTSMFTGLIPAAATEGAAAGESAGEGFASRFASMMSGITSAFTGLLPEMEAVSAESGAAAGESFGSRFKSAIMGDLSPMEALMGAGFVAATAMMASHFDAAMERIHTQAGVGQSAIAGLSGGVLDLAGKVGEGPSSLADALYHVESSFASVGITGQKAMSLLQTAAEGAREGNANLVDVTNALDATIASGIGGIDNYSQAMGALNAIVGAGDMSMQDLADAMGSGLMAVAKSYGQSIYDIGAALATFGDNNIRGAKAATDLRMAMQAILAPVKTGESYLNHLGLSMTSLGDTMTHHGLTAAIAEFVSHLEAAKVPISDWGEYVTNIFGKKAGAGIGVLVDQLGRLQSKMPDIEHGAHSFASAWADTEKTTSQKLHELESGFEALMVRIGNGLLPAIDGLMSMITRNLPVIEHLGTEIAHLVAPVVTTFFTGLEAILKFLLGPMRDVTIAVAALAAGWAALNFVMNLNPFVAIGTALVLLVGVIVKYHKQIADTIHRYWHEIEVFLAGLALAFPVIAVLVAIVAAVVKYHKQIFDAIKTAWDKVAGFFKNLYKDIVDPVKRTFDAVKSAITGGFDKWWKSHGKEVEEVWHVLWTAISDYFTITWDVIKTVLKAAWDLIKPVFDVGLPYIEAVWKIAWGAISAAFKTTWDVIAAIVKMAVALVTAVVKTAWDTLVGIFNVFLDLVTGHWGKAWTDIQNTATQVWNAITGFLGTTWDAISTEATQIWNSISGFFTTTLNAISGFFATIWNSIFSTVKKVWNDISSWFTTWWNNEVKGWEMIVTTVEGWLKGAWNTVWGDIKSVWNSIHNWLATWWNNEIAGWEKVVNTVEGWLRTAWDTIKTDAIKGFDNVRHEIAHIWDQIVSDIEGFIKTIEQKIAGIGSTIIGLPGQLLGSIGLAGGGVLPGYAPGHDSVNAKLSPGEAVIVPEAVRAIGPDRINAINAHFSAGRARGGDGYSLGGVVPDPYGGTSAARARGGDGYAYGGIFPYGGQQPYQPGGSTTGTGGGINNFYLTFSGTRPTAEEFQAIKMQLATAVGAAG